MYSPISTVHSSPFTSIHTSLAPSPSNTHIRTPSSNRTAFTQPNMNEMARVPSSKKLSLTQQAAQFKPQNAIYAVGEDIRKRGVGVQSVKAKFVSLQSSMLNDKPLQNKEAINKQLMKYFQQQISMLRAQYSCSLQAYEARIDELQRQLSKNSTQLQEKDNQIKRLEEAVRRMQVQSNKTHPYLEKRISDVQTKIYILSQYTEQSTKETQQNIEHLTNGVISCLGSRISALRKHQADFITWSLTKISNIEQRMEAKQRQQSVGTRQSIQSAEQIGERVEGVSFWDDCFFYPNSEKSPNCCLIAEMASKRSEPLSCWVDSEGYLRYYDSGSFFFNRRGEKMRVEQDELGWLQEQRMIRIRN